MNKISVISTTVRTALRANATITAITNRVFQQSAPNDAELPYIIIDHLYGGNENDSPKVSADMLFRVWAITTDQYQAEQLSNEIYSTLADQRFDFPDGWKDYEVARNMNDIHESEVIQNFKVYKYGGDYRFRIIQD